MKGIVFTELLEMVEQQHGFSVVNKIVEASALPSQGIYTSVGTYPCSELVLLLQSLSTRTGEAFPDLLTTFGNHLFTRFVVSFPALFAEYDDCFGFLERLDTEIHVEVRKLYPEAELPSFDCRYQSADVLEMEYRSPRGLSNFALGLLTKCIEHFGEPIELLQRELAEDGTHCLFELRRSSTNV